MQRTKKLWQCLDRGGKAVVQVTEGMFDGDSARAEAAISVLCELAREGCTKGDLERLKMVGVF
eukprot:6407131-Alexandrium_andersonii.AAC.2